VPLGKETAPGVILGTLAYMSPEQARGLEVDGRSDLFSLGVLLYEMLTGRLPFMGGTTGDLLVSILSSEPLPLAHIKPSVPSEMQWIVSKSLHKDKTLRYQSARDFIVDLRNLTHGLDTRVLSPVIGKDSGNHPVAEVRESGIRDSAVRRRRRKPVDSIAVLPIVNSSGDADLEYLSDGITESLINTLSRIPKLRVMARSTVFRYKGREADPQRVGSELNVRAVMTGRIRQRGDQFIIGAELVDVVDGSQLWGEQYTKRMSGILTLQDEISGDIGEKLKLKLTSGEKPRLAKRHTRHAEAYELYLKGRYHWSKWTRDSLREAIACFEQSLGKDPDFALAYSGLGFAYGVQSYFLLDPAHAQGAILKSKAYAKRAMEMDDTLAEAHLGLANIAHLYEWNRRLAEREFKIALDLNPNLAEAHIGYGLFLMDQGRFSEAMAEMEWALRLDPLSLPMNTAMGYFFFNTRRYDEAINQLRKSQALDPAFQLSELEPAFQLSRQLLGASLERAGKMEEAVAEYLRVIPEWTRKDEMIAALQRAYDQSGMNGFWRSFADFVHELWERRMINPVFISAIYASLEERDAAFEWIERAFSERTPALSHIKADPRFENLRADSRFSQLLGRMGLG